MLDMDINIKRKNNNLKKLGIEALRADEPHLKLKTAFTGVIKKLYSSEKKLDCLFYISCSKCSKMMSIAEIKFEEMECVLCLNISYPKVTNHWSFGNFNKKCFF